MKLGLCVYFNFLTRSDRLLRPYSSIASPTCYSYQTISTALIMSEHQLVTNLVTCENLGTSGIRTHAVNEPCVYVNDYHITCVTP